MPSRISELLGLSPEEDRSAGEASERLRSLTEWASDTVESAKDTPLFDALGSVGDAAKEWSGTVRALGKLIDRFTKDKSPQQLGWLAATLAYKKASEDAIRIFGRPSSRIPYSGLVVAERLNHLRLEDPSIMQGFSLDATAGHPFLQAADEAFVVILETAGYDGTERRNMLRTVRASFKQTLQDLLSGEQKEKFAGFAQWLQLVTDDQKLAAALAVHADIQRAELEDQPALGIEPFSIADVYIETECGVLPWKAVRDQAEGQAAVGPVDPFIEASAERQDLMGATLRLMADPLFHECIVIQGAPGAGKSTFTKKLCTVLHDEGLLPIRVPLQHLRVDANIFDAIQDVLIRFSGPSIQSFRRELLPDKIFADRVKFGDAEISPYVLIFDGWDEISLSAAEGFQQRIERLLDTIRQTFLNQNRNEVRIVLTGRPSHAVGRSNFLRDETPLLTIRPIRPDQLTTYVLALKDATEKPAFDRPETDRWTLGDIERYRPIFDLYREEYPKPGRLEVLGQPLLAHLAVKVMANFEGDLSKLITPTTTLYRHLVDLTCKKAGKHPAHRGATEKSAHIEGGDLRGLLQGTALAITAHGEEAIPSEELDLRLETLGLGKSVFQVTKEYPLTNLMVSFYFKGLYEEAGCEFLHKSFREYLTAEAIVEVLKEYGTRVTGVLAERERYWQDFQEGDPRLWFSRVLGEILSPQLLSPVIMKHLFHLLKWEVGRGEGLYERKGSVPIPVRAVTAGTCTRGITMPAWERVRDALADLWDWWGEGVHLRPQPKERQKLWHLDDPPYVVDLVKLAMRRSNYNRRHPPRPLRTATVDAHLGYGLFGLNCFVHAAISDVNGWNELLDRLGQRIWNYPCEPRRRYQVGVVNNDVEYVQFAPSGGDTRYFQNYANRINGAGSQYREELFPSWTYLGGVCLANADLSGLSFESSDMAGCNLSGSNLGRALLGRVCLTGSKLSNARMFGAHFIQSVVDNVDFSGCLTYATDFRVLSMRGATGVTKGQIAQMARFEVDDISQRSEKRRALTREDVIERVRW